MENLQVKEELREWFGKRPVFFMKFSDNKNHLESLQKGNLYMNNLQYYVDLEEKNGVPGMGDKLEALNVINDVQLSFYDVGTENLRFKINAKQANMRYRDAMTKPVFCLFAVTIDMFNVVEHSENQVKLEFNLSEDDLEKMKSQFGENVFIVPEGEFTNKVEKSFNDKGYEFLGKPAEYCDFQINETRRIKAFGEQDIDIFFFKDKSFEHQNEYRFVIFNKETEKPTTVQIDSLENVSAIMSTSDLSKMNIAINFKV